MVCQFKGKDYLVGVLSNTNAGVSLSLKSIKEFCQNQSLKDILYKYDDFTSVAYHREWIAKSSELLMTVGTLLIFLMKCFIESF